MKMKNTFKIFLGFAVLVSALTAGTVRSQGTAGASQLLIPVGTETVALSGTNVSTVSGVDALFTNVAGLARHTGGLQGTVSTTSYIADIDVTYAGMVMSMGETGTFGMTLKALDFGDIPKTTAFAPEGDGQTFSPSFFTATAGFARAFSDRVNVGVAAKLISETIEETSATGFAFDVGVQYKFPDQPLTIGVAMKNVGSRMHYDGINLDQNLTPEGSESGSSSETFRIVADNFALPTSLDLSVTYSLLDKLDLSTTFTNHSYQSNTLAIGAKYSLGSAWVGAATTMTVGDDSQPSDVTDADWEEWSGTNWGASMGAGVTVPIGDYTMHVSYAMRTANEYFDDHSTMQVTFDF
ncbi:MAG TPA: PorV/PorQ family protein [Candidatus Marinimicrobia bacterium]|jgi:hypothetical protein|nr:PorV/PorQ family protein [Candidatus Neomarinimicrobiota bacterium]